MAFPTPPAETEVTEIEGSPSRLRLDVTVEISSCCEDQELHQSDLPLFSLASTNPERAPSAEVPWSQLLALSLSPAHEPPVLTVGRHEDCTVKLEDQRVSLRHFEIVARKKYANGSEESELGSITYDCVLNDLSSNGTEVNNAFVGKGKSCQLRSGDEVCVLPESKVGPDHRIAFVFRNTTEVLATPKAAKAQGIQLLEHVVCPICMQVIHRCVALTPCLHSFCATCCSDWLSRKTGGSCLHAPHPGTVAGGCPVCRADIGAVVRNHAMDAVVEAFLESFPDRRRDEEELRHMDEKDLLRPTNDGRLVLAGAAPAQTARLESGSARARPGASIRLSRRLDTQSCSLQ